MMRNGEIVITKAIKALIGLILIAFVFAGDPANAQSPTLDNKRILEAEKILSELGYWILKADGIADPSTRHAIVAFQKVEKRKRSGILNEAELKALRIAAPPKPKFTGRKHIEVDLTRQVLYLVSDEGLVSHILPISSGTEKKYQQDGKWEIAHTPRGEFSITRQIHGTRKAPLGNLYNPSYFYKGVAIHGSNSIPIFPASHGCVRIPRFADKLFIEMVEVGMQVYVFD